MYCFLKKNSTGWKLVTKHLCALLCSAAHCLYIHTYMHAGRRRYAGAAIKSPPHRGGECVSHHPVLYGNPSRWHSATFSANYHKYRVIFPKLSEIQGVPSDFDSKLSYYRFWKDHNSVNEWPKKTQMVRLKLWSGFFWTWNFAYVLCNLKKKQSKNRILNIRWITVIANFICSSTLVAGTAHK